MSDLISRKEALKVFEDYIGLTNKSEESRHKIISILKALPTAEPEQKKGEWVYDGIRGRFPACKCSICGHYENADWTLLQGANYCPNCGADMRGEEDEHTD